jgi:hypothetical protein
MLIDNRNTVYRVIKGQIDGCGFKAHVILDESEYTPSRVIIHVMSDNPDDYSFSFTSTHVDSWKFNEEKALADVIITEVSRCVASDFAGYSIFEYNKANKG